VTQLFLTLLRLVGSVVSAWRRDPQFRALVILVIATLLTGTIFYSLHEGWSVVDSFYFCVTTLTTVGFGDLTPTTVLSKLFTVVYILTGISIILGFIDVVARETRRRRIGRDGDGEGREEDGTAS
jgi:voltage-gated potassium channel